jgi:hypothetical protein
MYGDAHFAEYVFLLPRFSGFHGFLNSASKKPPESDRLAPALYAKPHLDNGIRPKIRFICVFACFERQ